MCPELTADCPRCHYVLWRMRGCGFEVPLACTLAAALFFCFTVVPPFLEVSSHGRSQHARIETGPFELAAQGYDMVGLLVLALSVIVPGLKLGIMMVTLAGLETRVMPKGLLKDIFRWYEPIRPWAMVDVYLLGLLVAYTRLTIIASVKLDTALYALIGLMFSLAAANVFLDTEAVWQALDSDTPEPRYCAPNQTTDCRLIGCQTCSIVNLALPGDYCRRCDNILEDRKPRSIGRSWAYIIASTILYIPANLYPVLTITSLVGSQKYTIMGGIFELFERGLWPLGMLAFFASIVIPLMKLLILGYMLIQTQLQNEVHLLGRTISFRIIDAIGRWSMVDVFMISIMVALVRFGSLSSVQAQFGAACFAAVVVLTMLAVMSFDPRLMWDRAAQRNRRLGNIARGDMQAGIS
jgi:paraquat-inducible protein A